MAFRRLQREYAGRAYVFTTERRGPLTDSAVRKIVARAGEAAGMEFLPSIPVDPLLKPGQKPRPLRLLGQDPFKPLPDATRIATDAQPSPGPVPTHADGARKPANTRSTPPAITSPYQRLNQQPSPAPAPNSKEAFDPAELIEDFVHPICQICMGTGWVRDENGIHLVRCNYCEGDLGYIRWRETGPPKRLRPNCACPLS